MTEFDKVIEKTRSMPEPSLVVKQLASILTLIINGAIIMALWNWFVSPLGVMTINLPRAIGIDLLVSFLVTTYAPKLDTPYWYQRTYILTMQILSIGFGAIIHFVF